jgi:hypothetical protein
MSNPIVLPRPTLANLSLDLWDPHVCPSNLMLDLQKLDGEDHRVLKLGVLTYCCSNKFSIVCMQDVVGHFQRWQR